MKILKTIIVAIIVLIAGLLILALFVPKDYAVERDIIVNKPKQEVFDYIKLLKNQDNFSKWATMDPNMKKTYRGTDGTVGFVSAWESEDDNVGAGEQEITGIKEGERLDYELRFIKPFEATEPAFMTTEAVSNEETKVTWGFNGHMAYPMNLVLLMMDIEQMIGSDLEIGLLKLKQEMEKDELSSLGSFSVSLAVKDIQASKRFYEKLGFSGFGGNIDQNWLIMKNGNTVIGLFQGMFEDNILTFNPGWNQSAENLEDFEDVRSIQKRFKDAGINPITEADENSSGPASFIIQDPDGNTILFDQHR